MVIETCVKNPGGPTRIRVTDISVTAIQVGPLEHFIHISITTPVVSALKNYDYAWSFLEVPADILNHFWVQVAVSEVKRPLHNRFGSGKVIN